MEYKHPHLLIIYSQENLPLYQLVHCPLSHIQYEFITF